MPWIFSGTYGSWLSCAIQCDYNCSHMRSLSRKLDGRWFFGAHLRRIVTFSRFLRYLSCLRPFFDLFSIILGVCVCGCCWMWLFVLVLRARTCMRTSSGFHRECWKCSRSEWHIGKKWRRNEVRCCSSNVSICNIFVRQETIPALVFFVPFFLCSWMRFRVCVCVRAFRVSSNVWP